MRELCFYTYLPTVAEFFLFYNFCFCCLRYVLLVGYVCLLIFYFLWHAHLVFFQLLNGKENQHCEGTESCETGQPAPEHEGGALFADGIGQDLQSRLMVAAAVHDTGLHNVCRRTHRGGYQPSQQRGGQVCVILGFVKIELRDQVVLEHVIRNDLTRSHQDTSDHVGLPPSEQGLEPALMAVYSVDTVYGVLVVPPLGRLQGRVILHPDVHDICKVPQKPTNGTTEHGAGQQIRHIGHLIARNHVLLQHVVSTEPHRGVGALTQHGGTQPGIQPQHTFVRQNAL